MPLLIINLFLSFLLLKLLIPKISKVIISVPNSRSSHTTITPSGGGLIFVFLSVIFTAFSGNYICLTSLCLPLTGFLDDLFELNSLVRYFAQVITVILLIHFSTLNDILLNSLPNLISTAIILILIIYGTAIINFINFMDGIDGLVASCMIIIFAFHSLSGSPLFWSLVGSLLGFLILNWHPAKIFMGDTGSTFLGGVFFGVQINNNWNYSLSLLLISSPLLFDAIICIFRRLISKQNIFTAHKSHLYQRLIQSGISHAQVSCIYIAFTLLLALTNYFYGLSLLIPLLVIEFFIAYLLDIKLAVPFSKTINPRLELK